MTLMRQLFGLVLTLLGLGVVCWVWFLAETSGRGLKMAVIFNGAPVPALLPIIGSFAIMLVGLRIGFTHLTADEERK